MSDTVIVSPKTKPHDDAEVRRLATMQQGESDQAYDNIREAGSLIQRAQDALAQLEAQLAGVPVSQRPADVESIRSNLMKAMNDLQSAPPSARVPESIRSTILANVRLITSGHVKQEAEQAEAEENYHKARIAAEVEQERSSHARASSSASSFFHRSVSAVTGLSHHRLSPSQEREHFITSSDGHRTVRKIHGNGYDRSVVSTLGQVFGERNVDEVVSTAETGVNIAAKGGYAVVTADFKQIDRQAANWGRGWQNATKDTGIDDAVDWVGKKTGLGQVLGRSAIGETVGKVQGALAWGAGHAIANPINVVTTAASNTYNWGRDLIWGKPPEGAKPRPAPSNYSMLVHELDGLRGKVKLAAGYDTNHDGKISVGEVAAVLNAHGVKPQQVDTAAELQQMINQYAPKPAAGRAPQKAH